MLKKHLGLLVNTTITAMYILEQMICWRVFLIAVDRFAGSAYFGTPVNSSSWFAVCEIELYQLLNLLSFLKTFNPLNI
jgi:hypothetical protein